MNMSQEVQAAKAALAVSPEFGRDSTIRMPVASLPVLGGCNSICDPRRLSSRQFVERIERIHQEGNLRRKNMVPQSSSPAAENIKEADVQRKDRLREFGR